MPPLQKRILLVSGPASGGLKRHVETLAARLPQWGYHVAGAAPKGVFSPGVRYFPLDLGDRPRPLADLAAVRQIRRAAKSWQPDLIHAHGIKAALLSLLAFPQAPPPVLVTYHNLWRGGPLTFPLRMLAPRSAGAIAVSDAVRDSLSRSGVSPPALTVIRNGVDPQAFSAPPGRAPERPFTALFMGRLTEEKGLCVLLSAAEGLDASQNLCFQVAGDGPLRPKVIEHAGRSRVLTYLGQVEDVASAYRGADLVVMPSLSEGLPMTALECMASGLPLIASRIGGLPEVVVDRETGLLIPPNDPAALRNAICELAADRLRATRMGSAGRRRVAAEFTEERMLQQLAERYQSLLGAS
ncbi:MAG: glycosyltransferase family 4 protein [Actinomycetota bacterium]